MIIKRTNQPIKTSVNRKATSKDKYKDATDSIMCAIDALGQYAKDDKIAKESIANLGVVLLDLKSNE